MSAEIVIYGTQSPTLFGSAIGRGELGFRYRHVGARLRNGLMISAHWRDGVKFRHEESAFTHWTDVHIPCTQEQEDAWEAWLRKQVGRKYDWGAIAGMAYSLISGAPGRGGWTGEWFCASLMYEGLAEPGVNIVTWRPGSIRSVTPEILIWGLSFIPGSRRDIRS